MKIAASPTTATQLEGMQARMTEMHKGLAALMVVPPPALPAAPPAGPITACA